MAAVMNEEQFKQLLWKARKSVTPEEQAAVLAIVDQHEGIVHRANGDGERLLHWASAGGHVNLMQVVIDRGAVVNAQDSGGADALMEAAFNGHIPAATLALDHGADLNATSNRGRNALMIAAHNDKHDCAIFLLNRGVDLLAVDNDGNTALDLYGTFSSINPPLSDEVKEQRRMALRAAFAKAKINRLEKEVAVLRRPARVIASVLFSDKFSDVVLEAAGGERIPAHKVVLATSSECTNALLSGQWAESASGVVPVSYTHLTLPTKRIV